MEGTLSPAECEGYNSTRKYKLMQCGMGPKQRLQLLYPGRFLEPDYDYDGKNIPNENMEGLEKTRKVSQALRTAYDIEKEALSKHLGGKHKIYPLPAVEPDAIINDPRLSGVGLEFGGDLDKDTNSSDLPPIKPDNFMEFVDKYRNELSSPVFKPSTMYDWETNYEEEYPSVKKWDMGTVIETAKDNFVEHFEFPESEKKHDNYYTIFLIFGLCIIFILTLCYTKKKF